MAWFIHDKLNYSEMCFYSKNAAFNLTWREKKPKREIGSYTKYAKPTKFLTRRGWDNHKGDHSEHYCGRLGI